VTVVAQWRSLAAHHSGGCPSFSIFHQNPSFLVSCGGGGGAPRRWITVMV